MMMNLGEIKKQILLLSLSCMVLFCSSGLAMAQQSEEGKSEVPFSSVPENVLAVAGEKLTSESIKPDDAPGRVNRRDTAQDFPGTQYLAAVKKFADVALEKGRDTYGEKHTPLFVSESPTWAPPVLLENGILIKNQTSLIRWSFPNPIDPSPTPAGQR